MLLMYDSIKAADLPAGGAAYNGYDNGQWPDAAAIGARFPGKPLWVTSTNGAGHADELDVERGDATVEQAPAWYRNNRTPAPNVRLPGFYVDLADAQALVDTLAAAGIPRSEYMLRTAHWTNLPHLCGPACGYGLKTTADATQYATNNAFDTTLISEEFLANMTNTPVHQLAADAVAIVARPQGDGYWIVASDGGVFNFGAAPSLVMADHAPLSRPIVDALVWPDGLGLLLLGGDGGVFALGSAKYFGSLPDLHLAPAPEAPVMH